MKQWFIAFVIVSLAALVAATSSVVGAQGSNERLSLSWHPQSGNTGTVGDDAYVSIVRRESSIDYQVMATDLKPGNAYTLWFAIIADTSNCSSLPCPPPEAIADPASGVQVAFAGTDLTRQAYEHAVAERYRFYSYGDAMLIQ